MTQKNNNTVVTFGCRLNDYESQLLVQNANDAGLEDTIFVNTCSVTQNAHKKSLSTIKKLKKENPDKKIIATGCAVQVDPKKFEKYADFVIGNAEKYDPEAVKKIGTSLQAEEEKNYPHKDQLFLRQNGKASFSYHSQKAKVDDIMSLKDTAEHMVRHFDQTRAFVQIQNGCNHRCTFCIIPYGRGNSRSTPIPAIISQINDLILKGYKEVVLTGVDITGYGSDLPGTPTFSNLVSRIVKHCKGLVRLRFSSIDPAEIDADLWSLYANERVIMPHFHISMQSGSNIILKRMARRHTMEQIFQFCQMAREIRPNTAFGADVITGFPTESEENFDDSCKVVRENTIGMLHVFPYSIREGTPAASMPQIDPRVAKKRAKILREIGAEASQTARDRVHNLPEKVLVESSKNGVIYGKTESFLPVKMVRNYEPNELVDVRLNATSLGLEEFA